MPAGGLARSCEDAVALAQRLGFPVVAKVASADILHKSEVGGVQVGLADAAAVGAAWDAIQGGRA